MILVIVKKETYNAGIKLMDPLQHVNTISFWRRKNMSTGIGAIGLIVAIVALILMIYKGVHVAIATLIASAIVIVTNGMNIADSFVTTYSFQLIS